MVHLVLAYLRDRMGRLRASWQSFWFGPRASSEAGYVRIAMGLASAFAVGNIGRELPMWINADGPLNQTVTRYLIGNHIPGTGSHGRQSLLYFVDSTGLIQLYWIATVIACLLLALGIGGRMMAAAATVLVLGIFHRVPMLQGAGEFLIAGWMGYLIIDPGKTKRWWRPGIDDGVHRPSANIMIRLFQVHGLMWMVVSFLYLLADPMWWTGTAAWWFAVANQSPVLTPRYLSQHPFQVNLLSHLYLLVHFLLPIAFLVKGWRPFALVLTVVWSLLIVLFSGDWVYALVALPMAASFLGAVHADLEAHVPSPLREEPASPPKSTQENRRKGMAYRKASRA